MTDDERKLWNKAIRAAMKVCCDIDDAAAGQGHQLMRAKRGAVGNPHGHKSGEIQLGAMRCHTEISRLLK